MYDNHRNGSYIQTILQRLEVLFDFFHFDVPNYAATLNQFLNNFANQSPSSLIDSSSFRKAYSCVADMAPYEMGLDFANFTLMLRAVHAFESLIGKCVANDLLNHYLQRVYISDSTVLQNKLKVLKTLFTEDISAIHPMNVVEQADGYQRVQYKLLDAYCITIDDGPEFILKLVQEMYVHRIFNQV